MSASVNVAPVISLTRVHSDSKNVVNESGTWNRVFTIEGVHPFDQIKWKLVDARIVAPNGEAVFEQKDIEVPEWWNQTSINVVSDKYMRSINGVKENSVKQVFSRVCSVLRRWAEEQNYFNTDKDAQIYEEELMYALIHQYGAFNSPVWFNLGIPDRKQMASACFISGVEDTVEGIMAFQSAEATIFRSGSGSGANLSDLRSSYEKISAGSYTCGPVSWMEANDKFAKAFKSGGATRNAAKIVVIDMDHPDILETRDKRPGFIKCKADEEILAHKLVDIGYTADYDDPNGAYKRVRFQNANHSVSVPDSFMQTMLDDGVWNTSERLTGKGVHSYKARELWLEIAKAAWVCGDPGVQFSDTLNKWHTTPKSGRIRSTNPCGEFANIDNTACNLCAINLTKFFDGRSFNYNRFAQSVRLFSTAQMAIVEKADYPTDKIARNSIKLRPIGMNYGDLGALLMKFGFSYDSDSGRAVAARLASLMTGIVYQTSSKLASRVGNFEEFNNNRDDMLKVMRMHQEADANILKRWNQTHDPLGNDVISKSADIWKEVVSLGEKYGYYVQQATLMAPLGTVSFLMGMSTTGIEPAFSLVSYKSLVGGGLMKLINPGIREVLLNLGYSDHDTDTICKYVEEKEYIENAPNLKSEHLPIFDCAMPSGPSKRHLSPMAHIKMMAAIQPLITCAQSKTVNLPSTITPEEIADIYTESWRLGLKCVALYRDGSKASQPLATKERMDNQKEAVVAPEPLPESKEIQYVAIRKHMPHDVKGWRHKFEINGYKGYIIVNEYPDGKPGEVFLKLGKPGSTIAGLIDGFTQQLSIALQHGVPLPKLIQSFVETRFEPAGFTNNKMIRFTSSLYDYLFKYLDLHYYGGKYSDLSAHPTVKEASKEITEGISKEVESGKFSSIIPPPIEEFKPKKNLDAPPCARCGTITSRAGSCYLCPACGHSSGCS